MKKTRNLATIIILSLFAAIWLNGCETKEKAVTKKKVAGLQAAPDFDLQKFGGGRVRLSDYRGKVIILDFWATRCPPCLVEIPDFVDLYRKYSGRGLMILGLSLDRNPGQVLRPFVKKYNINYPILLFDGRVDRTYGGIFGIPTTFIIDRKGNIYRKYIGYRPKNIFEADIKALLKLN
ncbi:MAG: TlpA disulfide reductase family protein [Candidatus Euphemobacter frigidus]|nr:TlpA disulfide reductase family protein [Candidatus Euphemobacter frigidus]MDP8276366.1 TlpA disulfide reductase family protein [Candidatus Euphemobacter frigidus]